MAKGDERKRKKCKKGKHNETTDIQIYPIKWHENTNDNEKEKKMIFWWSQSVAVRIL